MTRLAVWGDPIEHSLSPRLHGAAYAALGLPWEYERRRVDELAFASTLASLDDRWRGLSLTMPLKRVAHDAAISLDERARLTSSVNTLLLAADGPHGFNTDVGGLAEAIRELGVGEVVHGRILGAGATAASAVVSLAELGARQVEVVARRASAVEPLRVIGEASGVEVVGASFDAPDPGAVDVTIATLPGGTDLGDTAVRFAEVGGPLVDVVYGSWPTPLALAWEAGGLTAASGRGMLLHQGLLQVRIFVGGDPSTPLEQEDAVLAKMRRALVGD